MAGHSGVSGRGNMSLPFKYPMDLVLLLFFRLYQPTRSQLCSLTSVCRPGQTPPCPPHPHPPPSLRNACGCINSSAGGTWVVVITLMSCNYWTRRIYCWAWRADVLLQQSLWPPHLICLPLPSVFPHNNNNNISIIISVLSGHSRS